MQKTRAKQGVGGEDLAGRTPSVAEGGLGGVAQYLTPFRVWLFLAALLSVLGFSLVVMVAEAHAATQTSVALLQSFNPEGAAKGILKAFAYFIALVAIFMAVGRFMRGATMQGVGMLLGGGVLFALAFAPDSLLSFGQWVLEQFGL